MKKQMIILLLALSLGITISNAQSAYNGGLVPLSAAAYANLPVANWDTLMKYALYPPSGGTAAGGTGVTILNTPPIGSQGGSGTCVGWAVGYTAMSTLLYPKYQNCWKYASRSPNYIYNQLNTNCNTGTSIYLALNLVKTQGVCSWDLMPFNGTNCGILPNATQQTEAAGNKALDWGTVNRTNVSNFKAMIDMGYPIIIGINTNSHWYNSVTQSPGIWSSFVPNTDGTTGAHAICIIGYSDTKNAFKVQDQSGIGGRYDNGFWWITYDMVQAGQAIYEAYVMYAKETIPPPPAIQGPPRPTVTLSNTSNAGKKLITVVFPASTSDRIFSYTLSATGGTGASGTGSRTWTKIMLDGDIVTFGQRATSTCGSYLSPDDNGVSYKLVNGHLVDNTGNLNKGINAPKGNEDEVPEENTSESGTAKVLSVVKDQVKLYPNPVNDVLNIQISAENAFRELTYIVISDLSGKEVKALQTYSSYESVSVADLPNGIYYVKVFSKSKLSIKKVVIHK